MLGLLRWPSEIAPWGTPVQPRLPTARQHSLRGNQPSLVVCRPIRWLEGCYREFLRWGHCATASSPGKSMLPRFPVSSSYRLPGSQHTQFISGSPRNTAARGTSPPPPGARQGSHRPLQPVTERSGGSGSRKDASFASSAVSFGGACRGAQKGSSSSYSTMNTETTICERSPGDSGEHSDRADPRVPSSGAAAGQQQEPPPSDPQSLTGVPVFVMLPLDTVSGQAVRCIPGCGIWHPSWRTKHVFFMGSSCWSQYFAWTRDLLCRLRAG